jgi:hypothetical protein
MIPYQPGQDNPDAEFFAIAPDGASLTGIIYQHANYPRMSPRMPSSALLSATLSASVSLLL